MVGSPCTRYFDSPSPRLCGASGHLFVHGYSDESKECDIYRCFENKSHCQAKVWIKEGGYHKHNGEHNHFADPINVAGRKVVEKGKNELRNNPLVGNSS